MSIEIDENINFDRNINIDKNVNIDRNINIDKNINIDENNDRQISKEEFSNALKEPPYMLNLSHEGFQKLIMSL